MKHVKINSDLGIETFYVEHTDTYGGEANYCWVHRFKVSARTMREALTKVKREIWYAPVPRTKVSNYGDMLRADCVKSPECFFVYYFDADSHGSYSNIKEL